MLKPELLKLVPNRLRLDSLFRSAHALARWSGRYMKLDPKDDFDNRVTQAFTEVLTAYTRDGDDDHAIDWRRLVALGDLHEAVKTELLRGSPPHEFHMLEWDLRDFWKSEKKFMREVLDRPYIEPEDDAALAALGEG